MPWPAPPPWVAVRLRTLARALFLHVALSSITFALIFIAVGYCNTSALHSIRSGVQFLPESLHSMLVKALPAAGESLDWKKRIAVTFALNKLLSPLRLALLAFFSYAQCKLQAAPRVPPVADPVNDGHADSPLK